MSTASYHVILTGIMPDGGYPSLDMVVTLTPSTTRADLLAWARDQVKAKYGPANFAVLFFSAEPNDIAAPLPAVQPLGLADGTGGAS